jgi:hypothetical protein
MLHLRRSCACAAAQVTGVMCAVQQISGLLGGHARLEAFVCACSYGPEKPRPAGGAPLCGTPYINRGLPVCDPAAWLLPPTRPGAIAYHQETSCRLRNRVAGSVRDQA